MTAALDGLFAAGHDVGGAFGPAVGHEVRPVGEVLDERPEHLYDRVALAHRRLAQVDALVVAGPEGGERLRRVLLHAHLARAQRGRDHAVDEGAELGAAALAAARADRLRAAGAGADDAGEDGVLPVVADVGDPVGPADHLALGGRRGGPRPAVVGDAVDRLGAQVERRERDERAPRSVVEPAGDVGVEGVLAGVAARAVPAVVAERDRLGERHVEAAGAGDGGGHLRHLERVGEPCPLVVLGEDEDLGLAGQPAEGGGVEDAVAVALEAGPPLVGLLGARPVPAPAAGWRPAPGASVLGSSRSSRPRASAGGGDARRGVSRP